MFVHILFHTDLVDLQFVVKETIEGGAWEGEDLGQQHVVQT